jgi:large conductance mechanosensitive channel
MDPLKVVTGMQPAKQAMSLLDEFKKFAFKGNVVDLAVGVIIGAAFGKIVDSLVKDVMMPLIAIIMPGDQDYQGWVWEYSGQKVQYGHLLAETVNFLIVAFVLFLFIVKFLGWIMSYNKKTEEAAPPKPTREQELLTEIRDLLKANARS